MRVLVTALLPGLSLIKQREVARGLSFEVDADDKPLYNVTLLVGIDGTKIVDESETLHTLEVPLKRGSLLDELMPWTLLSFHTKSNL